MKVLLCSTAPLLLLLLLTLPCSSSSNSNDTISGYHSSSNNNNNNSSTKIAPFLLENKEEEDDDNNIIIDEHQYDDDDDDDNDDEPASASSSSSYTTTGHDPQDALVYPWVVQILGVITFFVLHQLYEVPIPFAAVMFVIGMIMGIAAFRLNAPLPQFHNSIRIWSDIDSQLLLLVFLPGLIFRDAIDIDIWTFQRCLSQLMILAFPMVLVGTVLTAVVVVYILPSSSNTDVHDEFTWFLGLTVGSILASTDPVAVAAVLKQADAPPRLQMHIGGESMLNDGAAVVFYLIFSMQFLAEIGLNSSTMTIAHGILIFVRMSLGGVAVGFCFAIGLLLLLYVLDRRLDKENNVLQIVAAVSTAYMSYYVSEQVCQMSGVIACVTCGITTKALGGSRLLADPELMDTYLKLLEHLLNTLLFTLGGTVFGEVIANSDERAHFTGTEWSSLVILYVFVMIIRGFQVILFYPALTRLGLSTNRREMAFFSFAGLRGAVGIALALALDRTVRQGTSDEGSRAITSTVVGLAGGVSFLTLLVNGTLAGWLLEKLGLTPPKASRKQVLRLFEMSARDFILHAFQKLRNKQPRFEHVPFQMIQDHLPFLSAVDQEYLDNLEDQIQSGFAHKFNRGISNIKADEEMEEAFTQHMKSVNDTLRPDDPTCPEQAIKEVRRFFLKLLDAGYHAEVAYGGIHDDNSFTYETLHQSVIFTAKNCRAGEEPLQDWTYTNSFAFHFGAQGYAQQFGQWCKTTFWKTKDQQRFTYAYQKQRSRVVRTLVFLEAHRRAEHELRGYLMGDNFRNSEGMAAADLERAILTVLDESQAQVQQAEEWLTTGVSPEDLYIIRSHYMVSILLHKLALYVEKSVRDDRLKESEGRLYLSQIDARAQKVRNCQSKHDEERSSRHRPRKKRKSNTGSTTGTVDLFWNGVQEDTKGGRSRRKKQQSAPAGSMFWKAKESEDPGDGDSVGSGRPPLNRQWSICSNASAPERDEEQSGHPLPRRKQKSTGSTTGTLDLFWNGTRGDMKGARTQRKKQQSAPAGSMFWRAKESEDPGVGRGRAPLNRQWSVCSNASAPEHDEEQSSHPQPRQKQKGAGSTTGALELFWNGTQGDAKGGRSRRQKQQSAPAGSMFWKAKDNNDGGGNGGGPSLNRQWSDCSNASATGVR